MDASTGRGMAWVLERANESIRANSKLDSFGVVHAAPEARHR